MRIGLRLRITMGATVRFGGVVVVELKSESE